MRSAFDTIADIIAVTCAVLCDHDSSLLNDRGIDSLELLDVAFAIDDAFSITILVDPWSRRFTWAGFPQISTLS
jgi:acyl carrier protein